MGDHPVDRKKPKSPKLKRILWIIFAVLLVTSVALFVGEIEPFFIGFILLFLTIADLVYLYLIAEKYYNWPVISIVILFVGIFFKGRHWPLAGVIASTGIIFLCLTSLLNAVRFQFNMRNNPFLRWFGSISCIIISTYMLGWVFVIQNWSGVIGNILGYTGMVLFIFSILGMVFTLPGSNYLGWSITEKKTFFRSILIPMAFVFSLILITVVFSDAYFWIMNSYGPPLELNESLELLNREGLSR